MLSILSQNNYGAGARPSELSTHVMFVSVCAEDSWAHRKVRRRWHGSGGGLCGGGIVFSLGRLKGLPIDGGHGVGVDAGAVGQAQRRVRRAAADGGLAARHLRDLLAAAGLCPFALHLVTPHSAPTLSNGILSSYKHLICNETFTRLHTPIPQNDTLRKDGLSFVTLKDNR